MFKLEIETSGAAFRSEDAVDRDGEYGLDPSAIQLRALLEVVEGQLEHGYTDGTLVDCNGNKVGRWKYE